jgi:hypothetical protein
MEIPDSVILKDPKYVSQQMKIPDSVILKDPKYVSVISEFLREDGMGWVTVNATISCNPRWL